MHRDNTDIFIGIICNQNITEEEKYQQISVLLNQEPVLDLNRDLDLLSIFQQAASRNYLSIISLLILGGGDVNVCIVN